MPEFESRALTAKCFDVIVKRPTVVKSVKRTDPQYEAPADVHAEVVGPTVRTRVVPSAKPGHINARLLELAKYGR